MNLFKKTTATLALVTLFSGFFSAGVSASNTTEIEAANALADAGYIVNHSSDTDAYNLNQNVLRQEIAAVARGIAGLDKKTTCDNSFTDVSETTPNTWACYSVEALLDAGLIAANTKFNPEANISKAEAVGMMVKAAFGDEYAYDSSLSTSWQEQVVAFAVGKGVVANFTNYDTPATRGFVFETGYEAELASSEVVDECDEVSELLGLCEEVTDTDTDTGTDTGTVVIIPTASDLSVDLSPESTLAKSIPMAGTVSFGKFDFTAGTEDTTLTSIKLARKGLGERADFDRVWMEQDGARVSGRQTVGSDDTVFVNFSPALVIKAGETVTLDIVATLNAGTSGSQHSFSVLSNTDIVASAAVAGTFPITTATLTTANYTVVPVAFSVAGSTSTYRAGDKNVELGQFKLQNNASSDKSVTFKSISLRNDGTGDVFSNLSNLAIFKNGVQVSSKYTTDGKNVTFTVADTVDFGRTETYYIRGDIDSVELTSGDSYQFTLRYSDDLTVDETSTGFRATISGAGTTGIAYNITGGDIILSKATTSSSQTVAPGSNDVVLLDAVLKVSQSITLEDLTVTYPSTNLYTKFSSLKLMIGNNVVSTFTPSTGTGTSFVFEGTATVNADTTLKILANVRTNAPAGGFVFDNIAITDFAIVEYGSNGNAVASNQKIGSANGVNTTIGSANLTLTRNDGIADQDVTIGAADQTLMKFSMRASDVSDVTVTKLTFTPLVSASGANTSNVTNVRLLVGGNVVSTKNMSSGNADFNDINIPVAKNTAVDVTVLADFSTAITAGQDFQVGLSAIEARDSNSIALVLGTNIVAPSDGVLYDFTGAGTASVALNSSTPNSSILTPSDTEVEVARFTLGAQNDALKLTDLYVYNTGSADLASRIKSIGLYNESGTKLAGGSTLGTGTVQFALGSTSTFVIPKNTSNSVVVVKVAFNDITAFGQTNKTVRLAVGTAAGIVPVSGTVDGVRLVSESTGDTTATVTGATTAMSKTHLLVRSKPTVAINAAATLTTHTFTVTADANNRITLSGVTLDLQNPTSSTGSFILYKDQEISGNDIATGVITTGSNTLTLAALNTEISAGTTQTFILKIAGGILNGSSNNKRIMSVQNLSFVDIMNTGGDATISSISGYSNVGLPTTESTFTY